MPSLLHRVFNRGPIPLPGGSSIVDANGWDASKGFAVNWAPSMRMVVDLADFDASTWVNQTGDCGHPDHPNYVDQLDAWAAGASFRGRSPRPRSTPPASTCSPCSPGCARVSRGLSPDG